MRGPRFSCRTLVPPLLAGLSLIAASQASGVPPADPVVALGAGAKQVTARTTVPTGRRTIVLATKVTPAQGLGVLAKDAHGLLHSPTAFSNCKSLSKYLTCTYKIPVPGAGRYTIVFSRAAGPALSIRYTITFG